MIRFNEPYISGKEIEYIQDVIARGSTAGGGYYSSKCESLIEELITCKKALLTHSCTAALEMAAILMKVKPGDEVIMPSYTFVSTANAFVLRGATPVFVDISRENFCLDAEKIEDSITEKTIGIVPIHYAGLSSDMNKISEIAYNNNLFIVEDAAQSLGGSFKGKKLGSFGSLSTLSFHETKNINCGEGGALCINDPELIELAEIIREKGTNRSRFFRGQVDKYTWVDIGSSFLPSEINAAFLFAQLETMNYAEELRREVWNHYAKKLKDLSNILIPRSFLQESHNCHIFPIITKDMQERQKLLSFLSSNSVKAAFHYVPLHNSPAGKRFGIAAEDLSVTNDLPDRLIRLPIFTSMRLDEADKIANLIIDFYS